MQDVDQTNDHGLVQPTKPTAVADTELDDPQPPPGRASSTTGSPVVDSDRASSVSSTTLLTDRHTAELAPKMRRLMTADTRTRCGPGGPLTGHDGWPFAFEQAGAALFMTTNDLAVQRASPPSGGPPCERR